MAAALIAPAAFPRLAAAAESLGSVTIIQVTPANPSQAFNYTSNVPEMLTGFSLDQDPTTWPAPWETSNYVTPGQFEVTQEVGAPGWAVGSIECTDPQGESSYGDVSSRTARIRMDADEEIVCTFTNVPAVGDINIFQSTIPQTPISFQYSGDLGSFSLADDGDEVNDGTWRNLGSSGLWEGTYEVVQSALDGWDLTYLDCNDPDGGTVLDLSAGKVIIDLDGGETVDCTFTNQQPAIPTGDVNITLQAVPESGVDVAFTGDLGSFLLDDDGGSDQTLENSVNFGLQAPGTKNVEIAAPAGWALTDLVCVDPDDGTVDDIGAGTITIDLDANETVNCVVQIEQLPPSGSIRIILDAVPNDPVDVGFTGSEAPFTLDDDPADPTLENQQDFWAHADGTSTFVAAVPAGFQLKDLTCNDPDNGSTVDKASATVTVDLDNNEEVDCTFTIEPEPAAPPPAPAPQCNGLDATIVGSPGATTIRGTAGDDVIVDLDGANRIDGRGGNDTICTGNADDVINGGPGNDVIFAGHGKNKIDGGDGSDLLVGLLGNDTISGGAGNDWIYANDGTNVISGGAGDDFLRAGSGNDRVDGGRNYDTYVPDGGTDSVRNCEA
jgi:Ca2+-binding RTX toxin-like protein